MIPPFIPFGNEHNTDSAKIIRRFNTWNGGDPDRHSGCVKVPILRMVLTALVTNQPNGPQKNLIKGEFRKALNQNPKKLLK